MKTTSAANGTTEVAKHLGAGGMLRCARETQGMHIAMLAVALKVSVKKLEALEADQYELFTDTVFVRALASSVCRALKIDAEPILAAMPRSLAPTIKSNKSGLNTTFNDPASDNQRTFFPSMPRPLGFAIGVILLGIFAIVFVPAPNSVETVSGMSSKSTERANSVTQIESVAKAPTAASSAQLSVAPSFSLSDAINSAMPSGSASSVQPPLPSSSGQSTSTVAESNRASDATGLLTLHAKGPSWVEVVDSTGVLLLRTILKNGEVVPVSGTLPLSVVLGRADLVTVVVRGHAFDTAPLVKDNVARFEVK